MKKPVLYMMIGFPASGKSMFLSTRNGLAVFSSDAVRGEWFGDESLQYTDEFLISAGCDPKKMNYKEKCSKANVLIWDEVYRRAEETLRSGKDTALDGISLTKWARRKTIDRFAEIAQICGVWINTDPELCIQRDARRSRSVGEKIIRQMIARFEPPVLSEGFDVLEVRDQNGELLSRTENSDRRDS